MTKQILLALCSGLAIIGQATSSPAPVADVEERSGCAADNLLNALQAPSRLAESDQFCSAYLSIPAVSTVTVYTSTCVLSSYLAEYSVVHPLYLYNLQPLITETTPITYNSASPTPSTIPGGAQYYGWDGPHPRRQEKYPSQPAPVEASPSPTPPPSPPLELVKKAGPPLPSYIATTYPPSRISSACSCLSVPAASTTTLSEGFFSIDTTTTCEIYTPTTVATYAAMCAPSLQANAPQPNSHAGYRTVPTFPVASKMDCCAACTSVFNCVWWKFDLGTPGDGWAPGTCHYAYFIGSSGDVDEEAPAICPNGVTQGISNYTLLIGESNNNNLPGYNFGPCGNAFNNFESNEDDGYPDDYYEHDCGQPDNDPTSNPPGCA